VVDVLFPEMSCATGWPDKCAAVIVYFVIDPLDGALNEIRMDE
jgi:fructose-1,6-bisphosphatase/inositol monophosphatase family enzyme